MPKLPDDLRASLTKWERRVEGDGNADNNPVNEITFSNKPALDAGVPLDTELVATTTDKWYEWNVGNYLRQQKEAGASAVTFALLGNQITTNAFARFFSREHATTSKRPELVVNSLDFCENAAGQTSIEAENYSASVGQGSKTWTDFISVSGFSGTKALQAMPNTATTATTTSALTNSPRLDYRIDFQTTGTHYIWVRGQGAANVDDSLFVGLDGAIATATSTYTLNGLTASGYGWLSSNVDAATRVSVDVTTPGIHTLNLWMREDGVVVDKLFVTTNSTTTPPSGTGPAESAYVVAPAGLMATPASAAQVNLAWTDRSGNETGFEVERATNAAFTGATSFTGIAANATSYADTTAVVGTTYYYRVRAKTAGGESAWSPTAILTNQPPVVSVAAPVLGAAGTSATLAATATDDGGEPNLTYTWSVVGAPPAAVTFNANGTNAAKNTTATFTALGAYTFKVVATDALGLFASVDTTAVTVTQVGTTVTVLPGTVTITGGGSQAFAATERDQFGTAMSTQPAFAWSLAGGDPGAIDPATGVYTVADSVDGSASATASANGHSATAAVTLAPTPAPPPPPDEAPVIVSAAEAIPSPVTGTIAFLSVSASDDGGESALTYSWDATAVPDGALWPEFDANDSNAAKTTMVTFHRAGSYTFRVDVSDGSSTTSSTVSVTVEQTATRLSIDPPGAAVAYSETMQFTAQSFDQFDDPIAGAPQCFWEIDPAGPNLGTIDQSGLYVAPPPDTSHAQAVTITATLTGVSPAEATIQIGQIVGTVYRDRDGNATRDPAEEGIDGWEVYMARTASTDPATWLATRTTDENGYYGFDSACCSTSSACVFIGFSDREGWELKNPSNDPSGYAFAVQGTQPAAAHKEAAAAPKYQLDIEKVSHNVGGVRLSDADKGGVGAFLPVNNDDDNYSISGNDLGIDSQEAGAVAGEDDLLPIYIRRVQGGEGELKLNYSGNLKVYRAQYRSDLVANGEMIPVPVDGDLKLYVEAREAGKGTAAMDWFKNGTLQSPRIDHLTVTGFAWSGPLNVPGHSVHRYTAGGVRGAQWLPPAAAFGTLAAAANKSDASIHWESGAFIGRAIYQVNSDYVWDLEVNVVKISVETPANAFDKSDGGVDRGVGAGADPILGPMLEIGSGSGQDRGLDWEAKIKLEGASGDRGIAQMKIGFIQNAKINKLRAKYDGIAGERISTLEQSGTPPGVLFDADPRLRERPFFTHDASAVFFDPGPNKKEQSIAFNDTPFVTVPVRSKRAFSTMKLINHLELSWQFNLFVGAVTTDPRNRAKAVATGEAVAEWEWNASAPVTHVMVNGQPQFSGIPCLLP